MISPPYAKIVLIAAIFAAGAILGATVQGWRLNAKIRSYCARKGWVIEVLS